MTNLPYTNRKYLDALQERVLIFDGAMGTSLQNQSLTAEHFGGEKYVGCNDYLVLTYPEAVGKVHRSFFEVGVDVVETDTFRSNRLTLGEYGLGDKTYEINFAAAQLARRIADEYSQTPFLNPSPEGGRTSFSPPSGERPREGAGGQPRFVAGSIGPTGKLPSADDPDLSDVGYDELAELFREQATGLLAGGVDLLLIETSQDILEVKAAISGVEKAFADPRTPHISPAFADMANFPPMLIQVGDGEVFLDDARMAAERAQSAGVDVTLSVYEKMWHAWQVVGVLPEAKRAFEEIGEFVERIEHRL